MIDLRNLSVVIPSYNARSLLRRSMRTLEIAAPEAEVIVVDGASSDGSAEMVRKEFPHAKLLQYENHGFGHAVNRGLEATTREFILILNSDLFVSRSALDSMLSRLARDARLGAIAPVLLNEDGSRQHVFGNVFGLAYWPNWGPIRKATRVPWVSGACVMTTRTVLHEVGGIDETFFLYNEEYDFCTRLTKHGFHMEVVPERVVHVGGGSTRLSPELTLEAQRGFLYLAQKHAPNVVLQTLRRSMQFQGYFFSRFDPRSRHREMWEQLRSLSEREAYDESPFVLSGRGSAPTNRGWLAQMGKLESSETKLDSPSIHADRGMEIPINIDSNSGDARVQDFATEKKRLLERKYAKAASGA